MFLFFIADNRHTQTTVEKTILQCDEEAYNMDFRANPGH